MSRGHLQNGLVLVNLVRTVWTKHGYDPLTGAKVDQEEDSKYPSPPVTPSGDCSPNSPNYCVRRAKPIFPAHGSLGAFRPPGSHGHGEGWAAGSARERLWRMILSA